KRPLVAEVGGAAKRRCRVAARRRQKNDSEAASGSFRDLARRASLLTCSGADDGATVRLCAVVMLERRPRRRGGDGGGGGSISEIYGDDNDDDAFQWRLRVAGSEPLRSHLRLLGPDIEALTRESLSTLSTDAAAVASASEAGPQPILQLPEPIVKGRRVQLEDMPINELRRFVPDLLKLVTGRTQLRWDDPAAMPLWWPDCLLPWRNVKQDWRTSDQRALIRHHADALREVVRHCYKFYGQSHLLELPIIESNQQRLVSESDFGPCLEAEEVLPESELHPVDVAAGEARNLSELVEFRNLSKLVEAPVFPVQLRSLGTQTGAVADPPPPPPPQPQQSAMWIRAPAKTLSISAPIASRCAKTCIVKLESRSTDPQPHQPTLPELQEQLSDQTAARASGPRSPEIVDHRRRVTDVSQLQDDPSRSPSNSDSSSQRAANVRLPVLVRRGRPARLDELDVNSIRRLLLHLVGLWNWGTEDVEPRRRRPRRIRWGCSDKRPAWWPLDVMPFLSIKDDRRAPDDRRDLCYTSALRQVVRACYRYYGQEHLI
ncbi:hypothetical protein BOX15_Mlig026023g2, partial [Macrostomum lignano]